MKKERIKSTLLIALVISSLILTGQIWFNEKLWPDGYNFFVNIKESATMHIFDVLGIEKEKEPVAMTSIASPVCLAAYVVKDFDHAITVLDTTNKNYLLVNNYISDTIVNALSRDAKNIVKVSEDDWRKALFTRGFYVDYGVEYKTPTFAQIFGVYTPPLAGSIASLKRFIITAEDSLISDVSVYVSDESTNEFYKISTGLDKTELNEKLSLIVADATPKKRFSFFINADIPTGIAGETIFAPYLILNEEAATHKIISASNPLINEDKLEISMYTTERLLKAFSINPKTAIKYTDAEGSIMFVQSKNTLTISPDGTLSYTTVGGGKGLKLNEKSESTETASVLSSSMELIGEVYGIFVEGGNTRLYLNSLDEEQSIVRAKFNYIYDGIGIEFGGIHEGESGVELEFENGYLKSYRQIIRKYDDTDKTSAIEPTYNAQVFDTLSEEEKLGGVEKLFEAYYDDFTNDDKKPRWFVKIKGVDGYKK